ncbi:MAG: polysaccharide lyase family 8 super-sandwich domain-containing protein [Clostridia bacterium]|nr:polysaccharide lyase family 8 super-sandwich domain-containing protein [Clostridia bacterium]
MKKFIAAVIAFSILLGIANAFAYTVRDIPMTEIPESDFFENGGTFHNRKGYEEWVAQAMPEVQTQKMLTGNYAFVVNSDKFWNNDHRDVMPSSAIYNENHVMQIPASVASDIFGVSFARPFVSADDICAAAPGWQSFVDPRGFMLISKNINAVIDKSSVNPEDLSELQYRSYYVVSFAMGEITWEDINPTAEDWARARKKYMEALTFPEGTEDKYYDHVTDAVKNALSHLEYYVDSDAADLPFAGISLTNNMGYTRNVARAYYMAKKAGRTDVDWEELRDKSMAALDKIFENYISKNVSLDSNWFLNLITDPAMLTQAIAYLYEDLPEEKIEEYFKSLYIRTSAPAVQLYVIPYERLTYSYHTANALNPFLNYSNLLWRAVVTYHMCLFTENTPRMNHTLKYLCQIFDNQTSSGKNSVKMIKNGVYEDGSFVFHGNFAYNLGYGNSYLVTLAELAWISDDTAMDIKKVYGYDNVFQWMEKGWLPFIYRNNLLKIVQGRENPYGSGASANSAVKAMILLAISSDSEEIKQTTSALLKPMIDSCYDEFVNATRASTYSVFYYPALNEATQPFIDYIKELPSVEDKTYNYAYYNMDRFVHKKQDYTFMLAMSSERIDKYEAINNNGYSDWYTGDGMTYVLKDEAQYIQRWWQYVDKYAIPGTTVDSAQRQVRSVTYGNEILPNNSWAGGVSDGNIGVAGMIYPSEASYKTSYVDARKSYFMLDDKIVCLGSGISGGEGDVYTTVENYISYEKENEDSTQCGYVRAYVDGEEVPFVFDSKFSYDNAKYVWLEGNRGYVILDGELSTTRVKDSKGFCGNCVQQENPGEFPFFTIKIEHGEKPQEDTYCYVILPDNTMEETAAAAQNPGFEVLSNTDDLHAIQLADGMIMANIFTAGAQFEGFTFNDPCSLMLKKEGEGYRLYISDPTQRLKTLNVSLPGEDGVQGAFTTQTGANLEIDAESFFGRTYEVTYNLGGASQAGIDVKSDKIDTRDILLSVGVHEVSTKLYARSSEGREIEFSIFLPPNKGSAYIEQGRLFYTPEPLAELIDEQIIVEAKDSEDEISRFLVTILGARQ